MEVILNSKDLHLSFNKKLNKNENTLFKIIISKISNDYNYTIEFKETYLKKILKLDQDNTFINFFDIFMKKKINYSFKQFNTLETIGSIYIISSYKYSNNNFTLTISKELIDIFNKEINIFKNFNFNILLKFENNYSRNFFNLINKRNLLNNFIDITIDELKEHLYLQNNYSRFYDFEKYILSNILSEIKNITNINISYNKIKISNNRKIIALRFYIKDMLEIQLKSQVSKLISPISHLLSNRNNIEKFIETYINNKGVSYVEKNIYYAKLHSKNKFETYLIEAIKYNYFDFKFNNKTKKYSNPIFSINKKFENIEIFQKYFIKVLKNPIFLHLSDMSKMIDEELEIEENNNETLLQKRLTPFYNNFRRDLHLYNEYQYEDHIFIIFIEFNGIYNSFIRVYKK